jgi:hypothetical protein
MNIIIQIFIFQVPAAKDKKSEDLIIIPQIILVLPTSAAELVWHREIIHIEDNPGTNPTFFSYVPLLLVYCSQSFAYFLVELFGRDFIGTKIHRGICCVSCEVRRRRAGPRDISLCVFLLNTVWPI